MADVEADNEDEDELPPAKSKRTRARGAMSAKHEAMARFVVEERRREPRVRSAELNRRVRDRFNVSRNTADRAIATGLDILRDDFERFCSDAPRTIFDSYMEIVDECFRDRNWTAARRTLDSVRDMFGMRSAINVNLNVGDSLPPDAFADLSDAQLEALALLDEPVKRAINDVPSVERSIELAGVAIDAVEMSDDDDGGERG